ncbi:MAG: 23S rRNA (uracil-5-)-methyltransferase RumA, partial [Eubacterium sp.]
PQRVVYVSCDPATLARDLKIFEENGYQTREITPVDMFPGTHHIECVVLMSRVGE